MKTNNKKINAKPMLTDVPCIIGLATAKITKDYQVAKFSIEYLKKAIKILEMFDDECLVIAIATDKPLVLGRRDDKDKNLIAGILISPRVEQE